MDESSVSLIKDFTLAVNLLAYMRCFPECVRDGVPTDNNSNTYRYKDRSVQLGTSDKITELPQFLIIYGQFTIIV